MMQKIFKNKKQSKEAKKRFEHLMMIAKENPNKVFDLTACELSAVPSSLFVQCRVFLTESLLLHTNMIKSLRGGGNISDLSYLRVSVFMFYTTEIIFVLYALQYSKNHVRWKSISCSSY